MKIKKNKRVLTYKKIELKNGLEPSGDNFLQIFEIIIQYFNSICNFLNSN